MKIGRNDPCYCGSQKKYKYCCLKKSFALSSYSQIKKIVAQLGYKDGLSDVLCNLLKYITDNNWTGACHATCATLYVALTEIGYSPKLCMGEVGFSSSQFDNSLFIFDHSWIQLDNKIIDLAISQPLEDNITVSEPIVLDINIKTECIYCVTYGTNTGNGIDNIANSVSTMPFCKYMDNYPYGKNGLWDIVEVLLNKTIDTNNLRKKYVNTKWYMK